MEQKIDSADQSAFSITGSLVDVSKDYTIAKESNGIWVTRGKYLAGTPVNLVLATVGAIEWSVSTSLLIAGKFLEIASLFLISRNLSKWIHRVVVELISSYTLSTTLAVCFAASRVLTNFLGAESVNSTESAIKNYVTPFFRYSTARRVNNQFRRASFAAPASSNYWNNYLTPLAPFRPNPAAAVHTVPEHPRDPIPVQPRGPADRAADLSRPRPRTFSQRIRFQYRNLSTLDLSLILGGGSIGVMTLTRFPVPTLFAVASVGAYFYYTSQNQDDDTRIDYHTFFALLACCFYLFNTFQNQTARELQQEEGLRNPIRGFGPAPGAERPIQTPRPDRRAVVAPPIDNHPLLSAAFRRNSVEIARITSDINEQDEEGNTPLHWALKIPITTRLECDQAIDAVNALFEKGADLSIENQRGLTPFQLATQAQKANPRSLPVLQLLLNRGADRYIKGDNNHSLESTEEPEFTCGTMLLEIEGHPVLDPTDGKTIHDASNILQALKRHMRSPKTNIDWPCDDGTPLFLEVPHIAEKLTPDPATREANKHQFNQELRNFYRDRIELQNQDRQERNREAQRQLRELQFGNLSDHVLEPLPRDNRYNWRF